MQDRAVGEVEEVVEIGHCEGYFVGGVEDGCVWGFGVCAWSEHCVEAGEEGFGAAHESYEMGYVVCWGPGVGPAAAFVEGGTPVAGGFEGAVGEEGRGVAGHDEAGVV